MKVENGTGGQRLQVSAFNGETRRYTAAGAGVTVNGVVGTVSDRYEGRLREPAGIQRQRPTKAGQHGGGHRNRLRQGSVKSFTYAKDQNDITLTNLSTSKSTTYDISSKAAIRFNGGDIALKGWSGTLRPTLQLSGGDVVTLLDAYPGSTTTGASLRASPTVPPLPWRSRPPMTIM